MTTQLESGLELSRDKTDELLIATMLELVSYFDMVAADAMEQRDATVVALLDAGVLAKHIAPRLNPKGGGLSTEAVRRIDRVWKERHEGK